MQQTATHHVVQPKDIRLAFEEVLKELKKPNLGDLDVFWVDRGSKLACQIEQDCLSPEHQKTAAACHMRFAAKCFRRVGFEESDTSSFLLQKAELHSALSVEVFARLSIQLRSSDFPDHKVIESLSKGYLKAIANLQTIRKHLDNKGLACLPDPLVEWRRSLRV